MCVISDKFDAGVSIPIRVPGRLAVRDLDMFMHKGDRKEIVVWRATTDWFAFLGGG